MRSHSPRVLPMHRLAGHVGLFDLEHVAVLDFVSARRLGLPVTRP